MRIGLFGLNAKVARTPDATARLAALAEEAGYESWWAGEHVVLPSPRQPPSPMEPEDPILDPLVHLAYVAARTERLKLGTGIIILPQRNPVVLAKQVASLDELSGGRLLLGIGAGYLEPEMSAIGVSMAERGARTDEYIDSMRVLWTDPKPQYAGRFVDFAAIDAHPRPARSGGVPIIIGGHTAAAHQRAVQRGQGWYGFALTVDAAIEQIAGLRQAADDVERPEGLGPLEISVTPRRPVDRDVVARFAEAGVDRLVLYPLPLDQLDDVERYITEHAALIEEPAPPASG